VTRKRSITVQSAENYAKSGLPQAEGIVTNLLYAIQSFEASFNKRQKNGMLGNWLMSGSASAWLTCNKRQTRFCTASVTSCTPPMC
jgi:hypothetical protein